MSPLHPVPITPPLATHITSAHLSPQSKHLAPLVGRSTSLANSAILRDSPTSFINLLWHHRHPPRHSASSTVVGHLPCLAGREFLSQVLFLSLLYNIWVMLINMWMCLIYVNMWVCFVYASYVGVCHLSVCEFINMHAYVWVCCVYCVIMWVFGYVYMYEYTCVYMHVYACVCLSVWVCVCVVLCMCELCARVWEWMLGV